MCLLSLVCAVCICAILGKFIQQSAATTKRPNTQICFCVLKSCQISKNYASAYLHTYYNLSDQICNTNLRPLFFMSKCRSVTRFVLMVHGFERNEQEEMKHLAVKSHSMFTFLRAQVFQIHAPLALIRLLCCCLTSTVNI